MIELFIENQPVDINAEFSALINMAIDDIKDFGAKNCSYTKTLILPGTKRNNKLFGNIFSINSANDYTPDNPNISTNFNAALTAKAIIFDGHLQAIKGVCRIIEVIVIDDFIEYEIQIVGELGGFVAKLGNSKLTDLDFSAYDHTYSVANIAASWAIPTPGEGYVYPHIDYGNYSSAKLSWKVGTFRPALFAAEYITKILAATGYTIQSDLLDSARFLNIAVPHNRKTLTAVTTNYLERISNELTFNSGTNIQIEFDTVVGTLGTFTTADNKVFSYAGATASVVDIAATVGIVSYTAVPDPITLTLRKNGATVTTLTVTDVGVYDLSTAGLTISPGDTIDIRITSIINTETIVYDGQLQITSLTALPADIAIGDTVKLNDCIPQNILQKDFISSILKLFNAYVFEDYEKDRTLNIVPFTEYYLNSESVDWTLKVDRSKPIRIKPMGELNARYYEFNFKDDADYYNDLYKKRYNESYGTYRFDSEYEAVNETKKVDLIFSSTPLVGYAGEDKVYSTIFKRTGNTVGSGEENIDSNIRLVQLKNITGVTSWNLRDSTDTSTLASYTQYLYAGHLNDPDNPTNDLNFGVPKELFFTLATGALNVNQFNVYWSPYMAEITDKDSRIMTCSLKLSKRDVYQLDFSRLIYIDGVLYRLNSISDYNASNEDICTGTFLKIINRIY